MPKSGLNRGRYKVVRPEAGESKSQEPERRGRAGKEELVSKNDLKHITRVRFKEAAFRGVPSLVGVGDFVDVPQFTLLT